MKPLSIMQFGGLLAPGMTVFFEGTSGEPIALLDVLKRMPTTARGVNFITTFIPGINEFDLLSLNPEAISTVFFMQSHMAKHSGDPRLRFIPETYFGIDGYLHRLPCLDLAVIQLSRPDPAGNCSLGPCVGFSRSAFERARIRIGLVNASVPRLSRSPVLPLAAFDYVIETDTPLRELIQPASDPISDKIASHVAGLIRDGDTIQAGIGKIPGQAIKALTTKRMLRVHTGVIFESVKVLYEAGALDPNSLSVAPVAVGNSDFYRWLSQAPNIQLMEVAHTHSPRVLAQIERLVSVNSAVEVDLLGQVNAEIAGDAAISGPGGLPDFGYMAHRSPNGRSIVALPSTDSREARSRIVPHLATTTPVTLNRVDVDVVVTEFGIAHLTGKTLAERRRELAGIAHPKFREDLQRATD
jgi:acyl-CoA hydrolase